MCPDLLASQTVSAPSAVTPNSIIIYNDGVTNFAISGLDQTIISQNISCAVVFQAALDALVTTGGLIHFKAGAYTFSAQVTVPQHPGLNYTIEGEGWRNTKLQWTGAASDTAYLIESYSTLSTGWQIVTFKDMQLWGGSSTTSRLVKVLHLGRENNAAGAIYYFHNVRVANGKSPQITAHWIQDSYWHDSFCESYGSTPTGIIDLAIDSSSHINLYGCALGAITVDQSRFNMYGGTIQYLDIQAVNNYNFHVSGVAVDPQPATFTHAISVGTTGNVIGGTFDDISFLSDTNTPASHRFFYINNANNIIILNSHFKTSHTLTKTVEFTSSASNCFLWMQGQEDITKVLNSSTTSTVSTGVPRTVHIFDAWINQGTSNTILYSSAFASGLSASGTEANVDCVFDYAFIVKRLRGFTTTSTKNQNTILTFRDDGADVTGATLTFTAGVGNTEFDSGAINTVVAAGSKLGFKCDPTTSSSGSLIAIVWVECVILPQ